MVIFKTVSWKNFLSTGNSPNSINLNTHQTTLVVGKNGEGKSTVLDALCFGLFGKPFRNINKPQLINSINQKNCVVEVEFSIGNNNYKIIRAIKPNKFEIYQNDELLNQDAASKDYQKVLEQQILKLNYKTFTQVVILGSASFVPFMQLPSHIRREVIEDILDIRIFSTMNQILKEKIQETKDELVRIENSVTVAKNKVENQQQIIKTLTDAKKNSVAAIEEKILSTSNEIKSIQSSISEVSVEISELQGKIEDSETVTKSLDQARNLINKKNHKTQGIQETLDFFQSNDTCPSCAQGIPHTHKHTMVEKLKEDHQKNASALESLESALEKLTKRTAEIQKIQQEITAKTLEISGYNSSIGTLNKVIATLLKEKQEEHQDSDDITEEKNKLKELAKEAMDLIDQKTATAETRNLQEIASTLLKDTGIKTSIIREYLPAMNKLINKYLTAMDFYVHFELNESFDEVIKSRYRDEFTYASFSEGEKQKIDLALLFAWRQIAKMKNSVNTNLLLMDEIFDSSLDTNGVDNLMILLSQLADDTNVFIISHKGDQLVDKFDNVIRFEKKNDFSVMTQ